MWPAHSQAQTEDSGGAVFVMTNSAAKNEIISYRRNSDGSLSKGRTYATGGRGSGGVTDPLGSQGSLILANDRPLLLAVNAGSGTISAFRVNGAGLNLLDTVACGGSEPVAVAQRGTLVYVLNAGGASSVVGFRLEPGPVLKRISKTPAYLSAGNSGAASLSFSPDGQFLLVTEKLTNSVDGFHVQIDGTLAPITVSPSAGPGAFAVTFAPNGAALVAETGPAGGQNASAISSYGVLPNGKLSAISTSVPTSGAGTCWLEVTPNGKFVYTANSATSTISGFSIGADGTLTALSGTVVAALPSGSTDLDIAITGNGKFLYTLNSGTGTVGIFAINHDGSLTGLGDAGGLSAAAGYNGIAAN
jgi:6-phosphogluconolactonase (cycloisomerase 2 family)